MSKHTSRAVNRIPANIALLACALGLSGCFWFTSKHEGNQLRNDVDRLDKEVKTDVSQKVVKLQEVLDEATKLLTRNSANLGSELDGLVQENATLTGLVMEAKRIAEGVKQAVDDQRERLGDLEKRLTALEEKATAQPAKTPEALFGEGKALFDSKQWVASRDLFKQVIIRHSESSIAPEAQYYRAESHFRDNEFQAAIGEFQKVFDKYPSSRRADEALFRAGEAAQKLLWCTDARAYFGVLVKRYPKSSLVARSKKNMATLQKNSRNKRLCKS